MEKDGATKGREEISKYYTGRPIRHSVKCKQIFIRSMFYNLKEGGLKEGEKKRKPLFTKRESVLTMDLLRSLLSSTARKKVSREKEKERGRSFRTGFVSFKLGRSVGPIGEKGGKGNGEVIELPHTRVHHRGGVHHHARKKAVSSIRAGESMHS